MLKRKPCVQSIIKTWAKRGVLGCALLAPIQSQAIELENPNFCSSGITNLMSDMGLMAYKMADFMNGFCQMMPFFGSFCPDLDAMAGKFFSKVLESPDLTLDMLACADQNPSMLEFMLHVIDENPPLLTQMGGYMGQTGDGNSKGCILGERFTSMATRHTNLKDFFFAKINNDLYQNFGKNVLCKTDTALNLSELIKANPTQAMAANSTFGKVLRNLGAADKHDDGNEVANERMFYAMFSHVDAGLNFMAGMSQLPAADQQSLLDFLFLGKVVKPGKTCSRYDWRCTPTSATEVIHATQATYNMYAMIEAMADGVLPGYQLDASYPPVADSEIPANALFGQFMPLMLTEDYQLNSYGFKFFSGLISGWLTHGWKPSEDVTNLMMGLVNLQQVPFSMEDLGNLMSQLNDPSSPSPRLFETTSGGTTPDPEPTPEPTPEPAPEPTPEPAPEPVPVVTSKTFSGTLNWYDKKDFGPFKSGAKGISVKVTGTGDVNLYVRKSTTYQYRYDCISDIYRTSNESCQLAEQATYYILLDGNGYANSSNYTMTVEY